MKKNIFVKFKKLVVFLLVLTIFFTLSGGFANAHSEPKSGMYIGNDIKKYYSFGEFVFGEASLRDEIAAQMTSVGYMNVFFVENGEIAKMQDIIDNNGISGTLESFLIGDLEEGYRDTEGNPITTVPVVPELSTTSVITADETDPSIVLTIDNANYISSINKGDIVFDAKDSKLDLDNVSLIGNELIVEFAGTASANKDFDLKVKASGLDVALDSDVLNFSINDYRYVVSIEVKQEPDKTSYTSEWDSNLDLDGLVIREHYSDGTTETVAFSGGSTAAGYSTDPESGTNMWYYAGYGTSIETVTVTHNESGETTTFTVIVSR